ncbi:alpha/beta-hydrolase [Mollisia scopiformis]|uniref:Alpha/beta-hydrolase n=1 Tax=Mollisia scopiformis TaxID=149040 RepID=A0A194XFP3_MOLSC|nr:alpha/beta-hydrolase [Mollisia scopiformis]KUJ18949.1 alpha/beta-hydrolase [Mollisia scopiformis]
MTTSKPTIILLPGAWHPPTVFAPLINKLTRHGYKCIPLPLQATDQSEAVPPLQKDLDALHQAASRCINDGEDVMVVAHSWSGLIAGGGLDGLGKVEREKEGKKNGVVRIAYLCAFCPVENVSLIDAFGGKEPEFYNVQKPWVKVTGPENLFYNDLPPDQQAYWASQLLPHSYATKFQGTKTVAWKKVPCSYLICENDNAIPSFVQEAMVKKCQEEGAEMEAERIKSGHSPFLSKVDETADFLRRAAGEKL